MTAQFPLSSEQIRSRLDGMRARVRELEARNQLLGDHAVEVQKYAQSLMQLLRDLGHEVPDYSHLERGWLHT